MEEKVNKGYEKKDVNVKIIIGVGLAIIALLIIIFDGGGNFL